MNRCLKAIKIGSKTIISNKNMIKPRRKQIMQNSEVEKDVSANQNTSNTDQFKESPFRMNLVINNDGKKVS